MEHPGVPDYSRGRKLIQPRLGSCQQTTGWSGVLPHCTCCGTPPSGTGPHVHAYSHASEMLHQDPRGEQTLDLAGYSPLLWSLEAPSTEFPKTVTNPVSP